MKHHYLRAVAAADAGIPDVLTRIIKNPGNPRFGAVEADDGLCEYMSQAGTISALVCSYCCQESRFYKDKALLDAIPAMVDYMIRNQRPNKTVDFYASNYFGEAGFESQCLVRTFRIFEANIDENDAYEGEILALLRRLLLSMAEGLLNGGFHTPNHRWVDSSALLGYYNLFKDKRFLDKANLFMNEGIDCDEYGEFTERSAGNYNHICDHAFLIIGSEINKPEFLEAAKRNLDMMFAYRDPDGSVFTQNSRRKDADGKIDNKSFASGYYHVYLWAAYLFNNAQYAGYADHLFEESLMRGAVCAPLWLFMQIPALKTFEPKKEAFPKNVKFYNPNSDIYRYRTENLSVTIIANNANFLTVQHKGIKLSMRMCASFFAVAQFLPKKLEKTESGFRLRMTANGQYYWPFETKPKTSVWHDMNNKETRTIVNRVQLDYDVNITILENGARVHVKTAGCDKVPFKMEFAVTPDCHIEGEAFSTRGAAGQYIAVSGGDTVIRKSCDVIRINNAFCENNYHATMRGSIPKSSSEFTLYYSGYTDIDKTVDITCERWEH